MFNSYNDAHLMNDSYVFYATSTNTFSNPAFAATDEEEKNCYDFAQENQLVQEQQQQQKTPLPQSNTTAAATTTTKQRLIDFCDNFAFAVRGKMFIMETNFKRRLRGLRRFLNERVLPARRAGSFGAPSRRPPGHCSSASHGQAHISASSSLRDLISNERNSRRGAPDLEFFTSQEPISAKALGFQQERILTRLERIKRDSQRLFNTQRQQQQNGKILESEDTETLGSGGEEVVADLRSPAEANSSCRFQVPVWLARPKASHTPCDDCSKPKDRPKTAERARWAAIPTRGNKQMRQVAAAACSLSNPKKTCIVCYERTPNIVTLPCEHSDICSDCFIEIIYMAVKNSQYPLRCVLCRQKVERIRCSRRLMLSVIKRNRKDSSKTGGGGGWTKSSKVNCRLPF